MSGRDEPMFDSDSPEARRRERVPLRERVRELVTEQPYAVLCVQGSEQPYGALIAVAFTDDLRHAVFATPVTTRKYRLLGDSSRVALVVDNRSRRSSDVMSIEAVTVTGRSTQVDRGADFAPWAELLLGQHPYLDTFLEAASCALFRVDVVRYFHVVRFQEVNQWSPTRIS